MSLVNQPLDFNNSRIDTDQFRLKDGRHDSALPYDSFVVLPHCHAMAR
ncbi:hypothetical protein BH09PSE3_BH09PSE3_00110 [soil metagenome]